MNLIGSDCHLSARSDALLRQTSTGTFCWELLHKPHMESRLRQPGFLSQWMNFFFFGHTVFKWWGWNGAQLGGLAGSLGTMHSASATENLSLLDHGGAAEPIARWTSQTSSLTRWLQRSVVVWGKRIMSKSGPLRASLKWIGKDLLVLWTCQRRSCYWIMSYYLGFILSLPSTL